MTEELQHVVNTIAFFTVILKAGEQSCRPVTGRAGYKSGIISLGERFRE